MELAHILNQCHQLHSTYWYKNNNKINTKETTKNTNKRSKIQNFSLKNEIADTPKIDKAIKI